DGDSLAIGGGAYLGFDSRVESNQFNGNEVSSGSIAAGAALLASNFMGAWGSIRFFDNKVTANAAQWGTEGYGAVHIEFSDISVQNNQIHNNTVNSATICWGAGLVLVNSDGSSVVRNNILTNNLAISSSGHGGGLLTIFTPSLRVQENRISGNSARFGGGMATWYASPLIQGNLIVQNSAEEGGGIWMNWFPFENTINPQSEPGRFLSIGQRLSKSQSGKKVNLEELRGERTRLLNNTIAGNNASGTGGGIHAGLGTAEVLNSILWDNSAPGGSQIEGAVVVNYSDVQGGYYGLGNLNTDPLFADTIEYHLTPSTSPAIDAGHPDAAYNDIEDPGNPGFPQWPALGTLRNDMGAYGGDPDVTPNVPLIYGDQFRAFVERVEAAQPSERPAIVDSFMNVVPAFPFIEQDNIVYFIYRGTVNTVNVPGDANGWDISAAPMMRLADTDLYYWQDVYETDARLDYKFVLNGSNWILDPLNPRTVMGGFGPNSELAMPNYVDPPEIEYYPNIPHGAFFDTTFHSAILGNSRLVKVYTPPAYNPAGSDSFPVVLFHDGLEYISLGSADNVLDYLIDQGRIEPLIAVFVPPVDRDNEYAFNKTVQFESFIITELMPAIDSKFRTLRNPAKRAMLGPSFGGLISTQICYHNPNQFGLVAPYSPAYWPKNGQIFWEVINGPAKNLNWYLDWGTYEPGIMLDARAMRDFMTGKGNPVQWNEWHEGHSWGSWRAHLDNMLEYFFPGPLLAVQEDRAIPAVFELEQNYPNPFNPTTTIRYNLPGASKVILTIYNLLGQQVVTLVDEVQSPGQKSVVWDGRNSNGQVVGTGVYLYRLQAGEEVAVRKMILLK
ncbi:MAG: alpha/beta hydrolase-fold protein, partial [Calditrichia bacterium]